MTQPAGAGRALKFLRGGDASAGVSGMAVLGGELQGQLVTLLLANLAVRNERWGVESPDGCGTNGDAMRRHCPKENPIITSARGRSIRTKQQAIYSEALERSNLSHAPN